MTMRTVVHMGIPRLGPNQSGYQVHYLDRKWTTSCANVKLVSVEGSVFKLNAALLASVSKTLRGVLANADFTEKFSTVHTEVSKTHLCLFYQFVTTGTIPWYTCLDTEIIASFYNLGIDLKNLHLEKETDQIKVKKEQPDDDIDVENGEEPYTNGVSNEHPEIAEDDAIDDFDYDDENDVKNGGIVERDDRGMRCSYKDLWYFPQSGTRDESLPYQCPICIRGFPQEYMYKQHLYRHEATGKHETWACDICNGAARFSTVKQLLKHKRSKHKDMSMIQLKVLDYALRMVMPDSYNNIPVSPPHDDWQDDNYHDDNFDSLDYVKVEVENMPLKKKKKRKVKYDDEGKPLKKRKRLEPKEPPGNLQRCPREGCEYSSIRPLTFQKHLLRHDAEDLQKQPISFFCKLCNTTFVKGKELQAHMMSDHPGEPYIFCVKCGKEFDSEDKLETHMKLHRKHHETTSRLLVKDDKKGTINTWFCKDCKSKGVPTQFKTRMAWRAHRQEVHLKDKLEKNVAWDCADCDQKFYSRGANELVDHRIKEHHAGAFICQFCGKDFTPEKLGPEHTVGRSRINLIQHMRKHNYGTWGAQNIDKKCVCCGEHFTQQMKYTYHMKKYNPKYHNNQCPICEGVTFETYDEHKSHNDYFHKGHFVSRCNDCPAYFYTDELRDAHREKEHPPEKVICPICAKSISKINMTLHHRTYHSAKIYQCDHCPKTFSQITAFNTHYKTHQKVSCHQCGVMVSKRQLDRHIKSAHTRPEDKPFQCTICQPVKGFLEKNLLEEHMNIHLGRKPFRCELGCPEAAYSNRANLSAHIRRVHKGIKKNYSRNRNPHQQ